MHSTNLPPAGKAIEIDTSRPEGVYLTARIVEPGAVKLVKEGVYSAFSVGISKPRIIRDKVAKQGRVTDGVFSEVSIVDFPALPTAKFNIVKRSKREVNEIAKTLKPIGTTIKSHSDEKGTEFVMNENEEMIEKASECEICKGAGCEMCMGKTVADPEIEKKKLPEDDETVTEDLEEAGDAIDDAKDAQERDNAKHTADDDEDDEDDDDDDDEVEKSLDVSYAARRAHDALCDAFSETVIASVHPSVEKNGYKSIVNPGLIRTILNNLASSAAPEQLTALASAVGSATSLSHIDEVDIVKAHRELHKAFADAYPNVHSTPGSVTPGQFTRPFVTTGRAPLSSTGSHARIPVANHTLQADDFTRGAITEGQERPASDAGLPITSAMSAAEQIEAISRDHAIASMTALHDHIASAYPDICPLGAGDGMGTRAGFSGAGIDRVGTDGNMKPILVGATPTLTKSEKKMLKKAKELAKARKYVVKFTENIADDVETPTFVKAVATDAGDVLVDTEKLSNIIKSLIEQHTKERFDAFDNVLSVVQSEVEKLGSEPDPAKAPVRGTVVVERAIEKSAKEVDMLRKSAEDSMKAEVTYLQGLTKSGNPELRMRAEKQLQALIERAAFDPQ